MAAMKRGPLSLAASSQIFICGLPNEYVNCHAGISLCRLKTTGYDDQGKRSQRRDYWNNKMGALCIVSHHLLTFASLSDTSFGRYTENTT